jgi:uncharacterized membrane protein YphA (DoxX/SURF4 family)
VGEAVSGKSSASSTTCAPSHRWRRWLGPYLALPFRVALGVVFVVASLDKIAHPLAFAASISHYRLVPHELVNAMAICLPWIEIVCGAALCLGLGVRANALVACALLAVFIAAIVSALARGLDINCGCFSTDPGAQRMTRWTLAWDVIWLAMGVHALLCDRGVGALESLWRRRRTA